MSANSQHDGAVVDDGAARAAAAAGARRGGSGDAVLADLQRAAADYERLRAQWEQDAADLEDAREEMRRARETLDRLEGALAASEAEREAERARAGEEARRAEQERLHALQERERADQQRELVDQHRERANQLAEMMKEMHRCAMQGSVSVYEQVLKACVTLTGATRGLYVTAASRDGVVERLRARAAVDVDGYPRAPLSPYIESLCRKVLQTRDTYVCNHAGDGPDLPAPSGPGERFRNCIAAPVVLLKNFDGIVIAADKPGGDFRAEDIDALLSVGDQASVAVENNRLQQELQKAYLSTVSTLADAVEAKDPYTGGHCEMVSRYARLIAERLGLGERDRHITCYAALLHDVGKIAVSDGILNKPGPLSPEEQMLIRSHVRVGHDLIRKVEALREVADVVLHHHERYDGTGYPDGLKGDSIPVASRIVAVVDAYCAMITKRSYKDAYQPDWALAELRRHAGTQFDPRVVDAFLAIHGTPEAQDMDADDDAECGLMPGILPREKK
ncbi:MAG TPA: HD domain-containing phosphohydrolase [Gemmatimonadaceae bacterium]|nr:HD domain-containing phosphohydrolase [Gemmatimonadaceae bacterium]